MYDVAIIGSGPAGLSAALTLKLHNKEIVWFGSKELSEKIEKSEKIANYPGVPMTSGKDLNAAFMKQAEDMGIEITDKTVTLISRNGDSYMVLANNEVHEAKTVLFAAGVVLAKGFEQEDEYVGRGVSYCATCDGMLYRNKRVVVVGENEEGEAEANFLADVCEKVSYLPLYQPALNLKETVEVLSGKPKAVIGEGSRVTGIEVEGETVECDGIFFAKNSTPPESLLFGLHTDGKNIVVDRSMATNLPGVFAAGDCTGAPFQIAKAVGEGLVAALSAAAYIDAKK